MTSKDRPLRRPHRRDCRPMRLAAGTALAYLLVTAAQAASEERLQEAFRQLDTNADGQVSTQEFENRKIYVFGLHDANGDNSVERAEVDLDAHQFQAVDKNGDGKISGFEFIEAPIGQFGTYDTDSSGSMTLDELVTSARRSAGSNP